MKYFIQLGAVCIALNTTGCAHAKGETVPENEAARISRKLVRESVIFEPGTQDGAVVPDISAPRLRAMLVPEHVENGRLVEKHREWQLEGDVLILGTPALAGGKQQ
jgi:hypothetical protein